MASLGFFPAGHKSSIVCKFSQNRKFHHDPQNRWLRGLVHSDILVTYAAL
jgi:hypothetical protein